jgi:hypothetical protein
MHLTSDDPLHPSRRATRFRHAGYYLYRHNLHIIGFRGRPDSLEVRKTDNCGTATEMP